jgi:hypothetical protein
MSYNADNMLSLMQGLDAGQAVFKLKLDHPYVAELVVYYEHLHRKHGGHVGNFILEHLLATLQAANALDVQLSNVIERYIEDGNF